MRKIAILPTLLTLGNAVSGFAAIAMASRVSPGASPDDISSAFSISGALIVLAMLFDALDGYVARLSKSASDFGAQLDSLCDAISFGLAPAFLLLRLGQVDWADSDHSDLAHNAIAIVAALYMVCAILRLARFNLETTTNPASHKRFKGLPSPGAAGCVASLVVLRSGYGLGWIGLNVDLLNQFIKLWGPVGGLTVALLMVSRLSYPHFTNQMLGGKRPFRVLIQAVLVLFIIALMPTIAFFLGFWLYALNSPVRYVLGFGMRRAGMCRRNGRNVPRRSRSGLPSGTWSVKGPAWQAGPTSKFVQSCSRVLSKRWASCERSTAEGAGRVLTVATPFAVQLTLGESVAVNGDLPDRRGPRRRDVPLPGRAGNAAAHQPRRTARRRPRQPGALAALGDRLGGQCVQGHIDGVGRIDRALPDGDWVTVWFTCPPELAAQMVPKGRSRWTASA